MSTFLLPLIIAATFILVMVIDVQSARVSTSNYKKIFYDFEEPKELYLEQPSNYMTPQLSKFFYRRFLKSPQLKYAIANYKADAKDVGTDKKGKDGPKDKTLWEKPESDPETDAKEDQSDDKKSASAKVSKMVQFDVPRTLSVSKSNILKSEPRLDWTRKPL